MDRTFLVNKKRSSLFQELTLYLFSECSDIAADDRYDRAVQFATVAC